MSTIIERYHESTARLEALIEATPAPRDGSRPAIQQRAAYRMQRLRRFLARLGDPHREYPIVHVGGTSGKGSTSTTIAAVLAAAGYRTGLHTSPYLQTPSEKLQIDGRLVDPALYADLIDDVFAEHERWLAAGEESLTYGEAWIALTALFFRATKVDVGVLEVGAGGRFDLTNIVDPALSIVTSVGIDHTTTLGSSIAEISWHKAGIIKPGVPSLSAVHNPEAVAIIRDEARAVGSPLTVIDPMATCQDIEPDASGTRWTNGETGERHRIGLRGRFQAWNGATAVAAGRILASRGLTIDDDAIAEGLNRVRMPGRAEGINDRVPVLLDGAHNADKIGALAQDVPALLPTGGRRLAVVGVLEAKQAAEMIQQLVPVIDELIATSPHVLAKEAKLPADVMAAARTAGFTGVVHTIVPAEDAIDAALKLADPDRGDSVLVTGSLYLVGNVRERWYATDEIIAQRTPWPGTPTVSDASNRAAAGTRQP